MNAIVPTQDVTAIESVLVQGDLSKFSPEQRVQYYLSVCRSLGLNHLTKPFDYINLSGKLVLYAKRDATDQLRRTNGVSITRLERELVSDVYTVTAYGEDREGRQDSSIGAVSIAGLKGADLANAYMKAETKAKRRLTLSLCGLGWLDETEVETVRDAAPVVVTETGEIKSGNDSSDSPSDKAWEEWDKLVKEADELKLTITVPPPGVTTPQLRAMYKELSDAVKAKKG